MRSSSSICDDRADWIYSISSTSFINLLTWLPWSQLRIMLHASNANKIPIKNFWFFCFIVVIWMKHCFHHLRKVRLKKYYIAVVYEHSYPLKGVKLKSSPYSLCIAVHCVQLYCCTGQNLILSRTCLTMIMRSSFLPRDSRYISLRVSDVPGGLWICRQHHRCSWSYLSAYKALALPFAAPYGFFVQECFLYLPTTAFCISLLSLSVHRGCARLPCHGS